MTIKAPFDVISAALQPVDGTEVIPVWHPATANPIAISSQTLITAVGDLIDQDFATQNARITASEGDIAVLETEMNTAQADIDTVEGRVTQTEADITASEGDIAVLETEMNTAQADIDTVEGRVTQTETDIANIVTDTVEAVYAEAVNLPVETVAADIAHVLVVDTSSAAEKATPLLVATAQIAATATTAPTTGDLFLGASSGIPRKWTAAQTAGVVYGEANSLGTSTALAKVLGITGAGAAAGRSNANLVTDLLATAGVPAAMWTAIGDGNTIPKLLSPDEMTGITTAATRVTLSDTHWGSMGSGWSFADSAIQSVGMSLMSAIGVVSVLKFRLLWTTATGNQGQVQWLIEARARATGELLEQVAVVDEILAAAPGSAYEIVASTFTMGMSITTAKLAGLVVRRDPLFNNDDLSGAAILLGVELLAGDVNTPVNAYPAAPYRFEAVEARVPAWIRDNATVGSSGNARLLLCYAGAGPRYVYRKAKTTEFSMSKGRRVETLTGAAYVDQDTVSVGGSNVTAVGNTTHLGLLCNYITWPAATHTEGSSYCGDNHGVTVAVGQATGARLDVALSRALVGNENLILRVTGPSTSSLVTLTSNFPGPGQFLSVLLSEFWAHTAAGTATLYFHVTGTFSTPLTIYIRRRMLFDASGLDASECVPDFVDPSVDYGFGALGVRWLATKCGNTVAANGVIVHGEGAALPEPMGVQWQPAATGLATNSPPTSGTEITVTDAAMGVAGLAAKRHTATAGSTYHTISNSVAPVATGAHVLHLVVGKPATGGARPILEHNNASWATAIQPNSGWTASEVRHDVSAKAIRHRLASLGGDSYLLELVVSRTSEASPVDTVFLQDATATALFAGAGEYIDIAAFNAVAQAYSGTPLLASGSQTARLADDPATGLPAIGTGPFTAFVDVTLTSFIAGTYLLLFSSNHQGATPVTLYATGSAGDVYFYKDGVSYVDGTCSIALNTRSRLILRRDSAGVVTLFKDGALEVSVASTAPDSTNAPVFWSAALNFQGDTVTHANRLYYTALSDAECIAMTTL